MQRWDHEYVCLGLRVDRLLPGFVDMYFGPEKFRTMVEGEPIPTPAGLLQEVDHLQARLGELDDVGRRAFLSTQLLAVGTTIQKLLGERVPFEDEVRRCYGVEPVPLSEAGISDIHTRLCDALCCQHGQLYERIHAWKARQPVDRSQLANLWQRLTNELRRRTMTILPIPNDEAITFKVVSGVPWSGYNWYCGGYRSRVELNQDAERCLAMLPTLAAHETYPGHHVERVIKERELVQRLDRAEASILLYGTPECAVSEGIGRNAWRVAFPDVNDLVEWCNANLQGSLDQARDGLVIEALDSLEIRGNIAHMLHSEGVSRDTAVSFCVSQGLQSQAEAERIVGFCQSYGAYAFSYSAGGELVRAYLGRNGDAEHLHSLYATQTCPSGLCGE